MLDFVENNVTPTGFACKYCFVFYSNFTPSGF